MRTKVFCLVLFLLVFSVTILHASGSASAGYPCADTDIDSNCPLDTWVLVLAAIAAIFAGVNLYRKQKTASGTE